MQPKAVPMFSHKRWLILGLLTGCALAQGAPQYQPGPGSGGSSAACSVVAFSATPTFNASGNKNCFEMTLTGNVTSSTFSNGVNGSLYTFNICQDSTGGRLFTPPTTMHQYADWVMTASNCMTQQFIYDGTNLVSTEPWTPDTRPFTPNAKDDEFDGTTTKFSTWINQTGNSQTGTAVLANGQIAITGVDGNNANTFSGPCETLPSAPYTIVAKFMLTAPTHSGNNQYAHFAISDMSSKAEGFEIHNASVLAFVTWSSLALNVSYSQAPLSLSPTSTQYSWWWVKIQDDGTNLKVSWAPDGRQYTQIHTELHNAFLTATSACLMASGSQTGDVVTGLWQYVRFTQP